MWIQPQEASPQNQGPDPMVRQTLAVAKEALASARESQAEVADVYQKGIEHAMRAHSDNQSEPGHKSFTKVQKAYIMGLCKVRKWKKAPKIWHEIKKTKNDEDLRSVLKEYWAEFKMH